MNKKEILGQAVMYTEEEGFREWRKIVRDA